MPVTTLDERTALVVVDLQAGTMAYEMVHPIADVIANSAALAAHFRAAGLPVVLVRLDPAQMPIGRSEVSVPRVEQTPDGFLDIVPELDQQPGDLVITKGGWSALEGTDLATELQQRDVTQVVVTGIATSLGVESTARHAHDAGFSVTIATDAVTDINAEAHKHAIGTIFPLLAENGTTAEILALL
ncbi:isochorismatase family cysteine hydrolase [Streptomyces gilvus]|uniref:isochorismatase family cysteine hydrolase n=1 Tax=Streptomyces gilvus TaxID=2920937 RepID=UPI001F0E0BBF|nr:isochorismatase family cysteine hydrolase [Streptomyces sp. CME 23]MCH5677615.1 cysteine hydrolase [Streptomyces sp. CME 23]